MAELPAPPSDYLHRSIDQLRSMNERNVLSSLSHHLTPVELRNAAQLAAHDYKPFNINEFRQNVERLDYSLKNGLIHQQQQLLADHQQQQQQLQQQQAHEQQQQQHHQQQQQQQQQSNYYYMQQQKQQQQQQIPPAYNSRSMSALLPLPLPTALQHQHQHPKPQPQNQHQTWSPVVGGSVSSSALRLQQQESILRLPRGPDGSNGFQMRR
uniref:Zinc finger protein squeeze n=1 Tax=Bactrocera latifrons TaxID=174628 RepID=A0A0K8TZL6_BACLA